MSMPQSPGGPLPPGQGTGGATDIVTQLQGVVRQLSAWVAAFNGRQTFGSFTCVAAPTTVVNQTAVQASSLIAFTATNTAAGTLMGSTKSLYISAISPGVSFTVATASGGAAAGTETFNYLITTPV